MRVVLVIERHIRRDAVLFLTILFAMAALPLPGPAEVTAGAASAQVNDEVVAPRSGSLLPGLHNPFPRQIEQAQVPALPHGCRTNFTMVLSVFIK